MSYVITIRRAQNNTALASSDIVRLVQSDDSLSQESDGVVAWKDPATGQTLHMNFESSQLWTDDVSGSAADAFLAKLRSIAISLDARVLGEEGEDLTDQEAPIRPGWKQVMSGALGGAVFLVSLPFLAVVIVLRVPWILWKLWKNTRTG